MCWYRRFVNCFDTKCTREVRKFYNNNNLLVYGVVGHVMSAIVFFDMLAKLGGASGTAWSPLRLLGPTFWLPLKSTAGKLMAAQTLVHSVMYFIACFFLVQSRDQKNIRLMGPWFVMHCFFMIYQIVLVMENRDDYPFWEVVLGFSAFLLHVILLATASYTGIQWTTPAQRRRAADVPAGTELESLDQEGEEDENSSGHSAETVVVTDDRWRAPPPSSYTASSSHTVVARSLAQPPENQGGAMNVRWPWRWRLFRQAAMSAAEAAPADTTYTGIELRIFGVASAAAPQTSEAAAEAALDEPHTSGAEIVAIAELEASGAGMAASDEPQESGAEIVAVAELEASGAGMVALDEPQESAVEVAAVAEQEDSGAEIAGGGSQMSGGIEERRARDAGWFGRWRLRSVLGPSSEEPAGGGIELVLAQRRRSVGGSDPAAEQPLLQPPS